MAEVKDLIVTGQSSFIGQVKLTPQGLKIGNALVKFDTEKNALIISFE